MCFFNHRQKIRRVSNYPNAAENAIGDAMAQGVISGAQAVTNASESITQGVENIQQAHTNIENPGNWSNAFGNYYF